MSGNEHKVDGYRYTKDPNLYLFATSSGGYCKLTAASYTDLVSSSANPKTPQDKCLSGAGGCPRLSASIVSQMWDGTYAGRNTTPYSENAYELKNVVVGVGCTTTTTTTITTTTTAVHTTAKAETACFEANIGYDGPGIVSNTAKSAADCQQQCQSDVRCNVFTWWSTSPVPFGQCHLRSSSAGSLSRNGYISGPKTCDGSLIELQYATAGALRHLHTQPQPQPSTSDCDR